MADADILSRHAVGDYLRACDHTVLEAANFNEAQIAIERFAARIELVLCDVNTLGEGGIPILIQRAHSNQLLVNLRLLDGFEAVARAAVELSNNDNTSKDAQEVDLLVSYILYVKARLKYKISH